MNTVKKLYEEYDSKLPTNLFRITEMWRLAKDGYPYGEVDYYGEDAWISRLDSAIKLIDEAAAEFPKLEPIKVYAPPPLASTGDITTDILNAYMRSEREFADIQRQALTNIIKYIKETQAWFIKWIQPPIAAPTSHSADDSHQQADFAASIKDGVYTRDDD